MDPHLDLKKKMLHNKEILNLELDATLGCLLWEVYGHNFLPSLYKLKGLVALLASLFAIQWTVAHKAPLSMGLCRKEHWGG